MEKLSPRLYIILAFIYLLFVLMQYHNAFVSRAVAQLIISQWIGSSTPLLAFYAASSEFWSHITRCSKNQYLTFDSNS